MNEPLIAIARIILDEDALRDWACEPGDDGVSLRERLRAAVEVRTDKNGCVACRELRAEVERMKAETTHLRRRVFGLEERVHTLRTDLRTIVADESVSPRAFAAESLDEDNAGRAARTET